MRCYSNSGRRNCDSKTCRMFYTWFCLSFLLFAHVFYTFGVHKQTPWVASAERRLREINVQDLAITSWMLAATNYRDEKLLAILVIALAWLEGRLSKLSVQDLVPESWTLQRMLHGLVVVDLPCKSLRTCVRTCRHRGGAPWAFEVLAHGRG